jgi:hypothetical protein
MLVMLLLVALPAAAQGSPNIVERSEVQVARSARVATHRLRLTLAVLKDGGWSREAIVAAAAQSAEILGQCGIAVEPLELVLIDAEDRFRDFYTPVSRELARELDLAKPTVYFVSGTRQRPAFEAEAIGRSNSRSRPELVDTVWVIRGARDLGIVLAHELAHVLMDSGEHSEQPGNLMRANTSPRNTRLSEAQCARLRDVGVGNGLLVAPRQKRRPKSRSTSRAQLCPGAPVTPPPGCAPAPHRYSPLIGVR